MTIDARVIRRITWRVVPFLVLCYFLAFLDRVNVSVAALTMNKDLGLSQAAFGLGAGLFFVTYFIFEVPSNILMQRVGARRWIARIMLSWGLVSGPWPSSRAKPASTCSACCWARPRPASSPRCCSI